MDISELFTQHLNVKGTRGHLLKFEKPECIKDSKRSSHAGRI